MTTRIRVGLVPAVILCVNAISVAQTPLQPERITVAFSDPSRVGKIDIDAHGGTVTIRGQNRKDVLITARARMEPPGRGRRAPETSPSGGRRVPRPNGFDVEESKNVVEINTAPFANGFDFVIEVPIRTNVNVFLVNGKDVNVVQVEGEIEVENPMGNVTLTNVAGTVVVDSVDGAIKGVITRASPDKPMAFTTLKGDVDVTFPAPIKATFKLRSDHGDVITNFDLQTKPEAVRSPARRGKEPLALEVNRSLFGTVNGGGAEIELRSFLGDVFLRQGN